MDKKIKILVYGMTYNLGGVETYVMAQFRRFDSRRFHIDFIRTQKDRDIAFADEIRAAGSSIYELRGPIVWRRFLKEHEGEYDFIVFNIIDPFFHPIGLCTREGGFKHVIVHSHNGSVDVPLAIYRPFVEMGLAYERFKMGHLPIVRWACSGKASHWMFGEKYSYEFIKNGIDTERFRFNREVRKEVRAELGLTDSDFVIGNIGRFVSQKNHPFMIRAFGEYSKRNPDAKLLLIGPEMEKQSYGYIDKYTAEHGIVDKVLRLGVRSDADRLYQAMDAFILPSRFEGLPVVGVEAQCAGLPTLFSDTITREVDLLDTTEYVPIFENDSEKLWADALERARLSAPDRESGYMKVREAGFDADLEIKRVEKLYEALMED